MFFDTHVHFESMDGEDGASSVIGRAIDASVDKMIVVGGSEVMNRAALESAAGFPDNVKAAVGFDRDQAAGGISDRAVALPEMISDLESQISEDVCAIGEIGLDYHYSRDTAVSQKELFCAQLRLAGEMNLPVIVHSREADEDMLSCLEKDLSERGGVLHCFAGNEEFAKKVLNLGLYISFSGVLTFKKADEMRTVATFVPDDRLLIETDTPYLAPVPHRGKRNEPAYVRHIAEMLAEVRGSSVEAVADLTACNAHVLFRGFDGSN